MMFKFLVTIIKYLSNKIPESIPHGTAFGNRVGKFFYKLSPDKDLEEITLWGNIKMKVNPLEHVGGNLYFNAQFYDNKELKVIQSLLKENSVFLDIGTNIGAYTLWASKFLTEKGIILGIEADPDTFQNLNDNVALNSLKCKVYLKNVGVADKSGFLNFYKNQHHNDGTNSFIPASEDSQCIQVAVKPLYDIVQNVGIDRIDFIKIDVEGFEYAVLAAFFESLKAGKPTLKPKYLLVEINGGPKKNDVEYNTQLRNLLIEEGYVEETIGDNSLFSIS